MSDEAVVDTPADEPVSPAEPEEQSSPGEEAAPPEDETPAEDADEGTQDADEPAPKERSEAFKKLLAKYGGNEEALANAYFEQANSSSKLHQEIREIKEMVAAGRQLTQEEEAVSIAEDPYVKEINVDLANTSDEAQSILQQQKAMVGNYQKLEHKIAELTGEFKRADDTDRIEVQRELTEAKREMADLSRDYRDTQRDLARLNTQWKTLQRSLREAEGQAKSRMERERQEALQLKQEASETRTEFNTAMRDEAAKYGIDPSSKTYNVLNETIRSRIYLHMQALKAQGVREGIDLSRAVSAMMDEYAEAMELKKSLTVKSKQKLETLNPKKLDAPVSGKAPSKDQRMSAEQWRERARRLMP